MLLSTSDWRVFVLDQSYRANSTIHPVGELSFFVQLFLAVLVVGAHVGWPWSHKAICKQVEHNLLSRIPGAIVLVALRGLMSVTTTD